MEELVLDVNSYVRIIGRFRGEAYKNLLIKITRWDRDPTSNIVWFDSDILFDFNARDNTGIFKFSEADVNLFEVFNVISEQAANELMREVEAIEPTVPRMIQAPNFMPDFLIGARPEIEEAVANIEPREFAEIRASGEPMERIESRDQEEQEPEAEAEVEIENIPSHVINMQDPGINEWERGEVSPFEVSGNFMKNLDKVVGFLTEEMFVEIDKAIDITGHKIFMNISERNQAKIIAQKINQLMSCSSYDINFEDAFEIHFDNNVITAISIGVGYWFIIDSNCDEDSPHKTRTVIEIPLEISGQIKAKKIENTYNLREALTNTNLDYEYLRDNSKVIENYNFKNLENISELNNVVLETLSDGWVKALRYHLVEFGKNNLPEEMLNFIDPAGILQKGPADDLRKAC